MSLGLTIHIEKSGPAAAYTMMFHKTDSSVIQIGRRPGTDNDTHEYDPGKAMFRCPVVSRKHAKITFTDAGSVRIYLPRPPYMLIPFGPGQVYLFDLGSHHGTHVRKPEEVFSRMLKPESPCLLSGGEFVTLGKSVGRGDDLVRPVVFRVEIHHVQPSPLNKLIDLTRSASSERQLSPITKLNPLKSSGRYGLNDTSSSSSDEMSSSYMNDNSSDIDDNPGTPSEDRCAPLFDSTHSSSHIGHALEVLRGLVPPVHPPVPQRSQSTSREHSPLFVFPPIDMPAWYSSTHRPRLPTSPPFDLPPLIQCSDKASDISDWNKLYADGFDEISKSRSNSPMDLASPSPDPSDFNHVSTSEPNVVGAWPNSPRTSSVPSVSSLYVECGTITPLVDEASNAPIQMPRQESSVPIVPQKSVDDSNMDHHTCPLKELFTVCETEVTTLKASLNDLKVSTSYLYMIWITH